MIVFWGPSGGVLIYETYCIFSEPFRVQSKVYEALLGNVVVSINRRTPKWTPTHSKPYYKAPEKVPLFMKSALSTRARTCWNCEQNEKRAIAIVTPEFPV